MTSFKLKDILSLLEKANSIGIKISLDDNELVVQVQKEQEIDSAFLHELKHNKEYIIEYLKTRKQHGRTGFTGNVSAYDRKEGMHIPLSYSQERLWFIHQLEGSVQYHIPAMLRISGPLDSNVLAHTLRTIVDRHEILRTVIAQEEGEMYQRILAKGQLSLTVVAGEAYREDDNALKNYVRLLADAPFDLEKDHMLRAHLIVLDKEEHVLVVVLHHIASDAWSSGIILQELVTLYDAHTAGKKLQLPDLPIQYADYAIWQRSEIINGVLERKLEYWKEKLKGATMLQLPSDHQRPADQRYRGSSASFLLDKDLTARLQDLSLQQDATLYMTMLAVFKVLLHRYSGQDDIVVGSSTAGRQLRELEGLVGFFSNTLTLRSNLGNDPSFISLLQQVKQTTLEGFDHQDVPFGKVVEAVVKERDKRGNPLFQVMFVQQNRLDIAGIALGKATVYPELIEQTTSKFDLTLFIQETPTGINVYTEYNADLFTPDTIDRLQGHFEVLLRAVVDVPAAHISSLNMLRSDERMLLLNGADKETQYMPLSDKSILTQFEEQAVRHPDTIALISENNTITYRHLNEHANQLGNYLRGEGVGEGTLVPVCMERSSEMIVAILGILKAGGAYVPLEPNLPAERIAYVLTDTAASIVISNSLYKSRLPETGTCQIISIDDDAEKISSFPTEAPGVFPVADQLVYVIYTSGSTGKPKGVMVTHGNITDYMGGLQARLNIDSCRSFGLLSSIATDLGNTVIYSSLAVGGTLHVLSKALTNDAEKIRTYFNQHRIDCIKVVPSHWKALCDGDALLLPEKLLIFGGESLEVAVVEKIRRSGAACVVVNHYGPTETTIGKLLHIVETGRSYEENIPIGKPFSSAHIYILDAGGNPCPVGIPGELYIGGKGVAQGYLNNAALTAEKFMQDPFNGQGKLYRTGDRVKYQADGNVVFLGRIDNQVKIRGYRVEPGEIENVIMQHADIQQAVVQVRKDNSGNNRLVGYVQAHSHADIASLEAYLKEQLPDYMVPSSWVVLEQFPQLPNGKIDRRSLPVEDSTSFISGYVAPVTGIERDLAAIWSDLLEVEQVGLYDDFFALGGHSLLAIRLISSIRKRLQMEVAIGDIFDYPTIAALSAQLQHRSPATLAPVIKNHTRPEYIPLSYSQERLWFIDQLEGSVQYNRPAVLRLKGILKIKALDDALREIVNRHEVLRTVIRSKDGQPYQYVLGKDTWKLRLTERTLPHAAVSAHIKALAEEPFDLSADHMLRAHLIAQEDDHLLVLVLHHIASDGWSLGILVRELTTLYNAYAIGNSVQLPAPGIQYADYAIWQRAHLSGPVLEEKLAYWQQKLSGITTLQLPSDYSRPAVQSTRGDVINFNISKSVMQELQQLGRLHGGTLYMTLLAAFKVLLYRYSGQEDICVGSPVSGRSQLETEELIGFFINTLTLRNNLHDNPSFSSLLQQIKETTLEAFAHQEVPFGKIVEAVVKERDAGRSPLFQVLFSLQNTPDIPELYLNELQVSEMQVEHSTAQFDLAVSMRETENGLWGDIEYSTDLFSADTIRRMVRHFQRLLEAVAQSPDERIDNLEMLTAEEENTLLSISAGQTTENLLPSGKTVVSLFEERVTNIPDTTAVITAGGSFSFRDIDTRSNQLAHYLIASGVKKETLVPICIDLSVEMIIGILGVLKAGAAYVPLDPGLPPARLEYMLKDTAALVVITNRKTHQTLDNQTNIKTLILDINGDATRHYPVFSPAVTPDPHHLAYVIYTSGSTGVPKGVMVAHRNLLHYLLNSKTAYLNENKTGTGSYLHLSYSFDASLTALFMPLLAGKSIVLGSGSQATVFEDPLFWKYAPYDFIKLTPAHLPLLEVAMNNHLAEYPAEKLVLGGEALQLTALRYLLNKKWNIEIINEYGPTEATVGCSIYRFNTQDHIDVQNNNISIGKPIDNTAIYILDRNLKMTPVGVAGEIYIGGGGVARGYLHLPELTSDRFVSASPALGGRERLYRTGDIAKWLPDGNIEYLGREDDQVKIRGYRIALGEIEAVLTQCTLVRQAVVIFDTDENGDQRLIGYVVPKGDFDREGIEAWLKQHLPHYMIPSFLIGIPALALTVNGKIDRKSLPAPDTSVQIISTYIAPRSETEKTMTAIWESLLDVTGIGIHDDFFTLGGHSLLAVRLLSTIKKSLQTDLSVSDVFSSPTIASLCELITTRSGKLLLPAITAAERPKHIPLSYSQERLWFIDQLEGSTQYHIPAVLRLEGHLNRNALGNALQTIVNRHEVLRTVISQDGGHAYQQVLDKGYWQMTITDRSAAGAGNENAYIKSLIDAPFDLSKDHMLRAHLVVLEENVHLLVVTLHHIASDGWSASIIVKELVELYNAYTEGREPILPALNIQYADYALWQRRHLQGAALNKQLVYWKKKLTGVPSLDLPLDYERPVVNTTAGGMVTLMIDNRLAEEVRNLSRQFKVTLYMTLLAVFKVLLYRYSRQKDICVGGAIAARLQQETEGLIGFFVNSLVLRSDLGGNPSFADLLLRVKETMLEAYDNQEAPFEKIVEMLMGERDVNKNPLFQVMFVLQNTPEAPEIRLGDVSLSMEIFPHTTSRLDLGLAITEEPEGLRLDMEYRTDLFKQETINGMLKHYEALLRSAVNAHEKPIGALSMLSAAEQQLLVGFNSSTSGTERSIVRLFEEQANNTPDAVALVFEESVFTYRQLDQRANQLGHYLRMKGVKEETLVPLCIDRTPDMIVGILGILKAGGAYVPIDPSIPAERIAFMLKDITANVAVSSVLCKSCVKGEREIEIVVLDEDRDNISRQPVTKVASRLKEENVAYVIYTSGSTGKPKGVLIEHRSLINLIVHQSKIFDIKSDERVLLLSNYSFDASVEQIFFALLNGAALVLAPSDIQLDIRLFEQFLRDARITHLEATPGFLATINPGKYDSLRRMISGGELCKRELAERWYKQLGFYNVYGPTEATISAVAYHYLPGSHDKNAALPIGKPLTNVTVYILDEYDNAVPVGAAGELCIGGPGVARGYLNNPELTAQKFIADPFSQVAGARLYKTGDKARWLSDGNIEYLGRLDDQVKIRGYRVELGELEYTLNQQDAITACCVVMKPGQAGTNKLVGYYVPDKQTVKMREQELFLKQVEHWQELYDTEYTKNEEAFIADEEFNIEGWNDSFTGSPIPADEMRGWQQDILDVILSHKPVNVLEIGCGSGLIYYPLAGHIKRYIGTDFSAVSLRKIRNRINNGGKVYPSTLLKTCAAHEITLDENEVVDTIVLNSVVQYFPGENYLTDVIAGSIPLLKGKGQIIIGDVRDCRLLQHFRSRVSLPKFQDKHSVKEFMWEVNRDLLKEQELCLAPEYFHHLKTLFPEITRIALQWKKGDYINELILYRYTVIIYVGVEQPVLKPEWQQWERISGNGDVISALNQKVPVIALQGVPNPRLQMDILLDKGLKDSFVTSTGDLSAYIAQDDADCNRVNEWLRAAVSNGYHYRFLLNEDPLKTDVLIELEPFTGFVSSAYDHQHSLTAVLGNNPLFNDFSESLHQDIRRRLKEQLPEYMIPAEFVPLPRLPLTTNGKADRQFLTTWADQRESRIDRYEAPVTEIERHLAGIWQELLGVPRVGLHDNFFELGGDSIITIQVISRARHAGYELHPRDLFLYQTVAKLAMLLTGKTTQQIVGERGGLTGGSNLLPIVPRPPHLPLSYGQERLWFIDQLEGTVQYHMPVVLRMKGYLDTYALEYALRTIVNRHEILRTVIRENDGNAYQYVLDTDKWQLSLVTEPVPAGDAGVFHTYIKALVDHPFDLSVDYMLRAHLVTLAKDDYVFVLTMHHIAADGWSVSIILQELAALYDAGINRRELQLPALHIQYADYAVWQRTHLSGDVMENQLAYWKKKMSGVTVLELPTDYVRPDVQSVSGAVVNFKLDAELLASLKELSRKQDATLFMSLLAVFKVLLYRYTGQEDICVGTPLVGRMQREVEGLVGFFVNTLPLRSNLMGDLSFVSLLDQLKQTTLEAFDHESVPFEKIVKEVTPGRHLSRSPLFQVMFGLQNIPDAPALQLGELILFEEAVEQTATQFDLSVTARESMTGLQGSVTYRSELFHSDTIRQMMNHFVQLVRSVVQEPSAPISTIPMLSTTEVQQLISGFNDTRVDYPEQMTLSDLFAAQAERTPDAVAAVFEEQQISYGALAERTNQLAHYLRSKGVREETLVPVCLERSLEMIIAILGIMKAGGVYVPVDPAYPAERIAFILSDTKAELVLTVAAQRRLFDMAAVGVVVLDEQWPLIAESPAEQVETSLQRHHAAYVIYTSGSTGAPKGVINEHAGIVNRLLWAQDYFKLNAADIVLQKTTFCFDVSVWELLLPLIAGSRIVFALPEGQKDPHYLQQVIERYGVTTIHFVPPMLSVFLENIAEGDCPSLLRVICSGEALKVNQVKHFRKKFPVTEVYNLYGPTEAAIDVSCWHVPHDTSRLEIIPIGRPVANTQLYILNGSGAVVPRGGLGELYIGGVQVARGYLNREELTAEKFISDSFITAEGNRLYKTGDLARWLPDGTVDYLGRIDTQVKIRGYRIELGEIENVILASGQISECVVVARNAGEDDKRLIAYVVARNGFNKEEIISFLKRKLPEYMVPVVFVKMDELPLTASGKADRKSLPEITQTDEWLTNNYVAPRNEREQVLTDIWQELLGIPRVGIYDNFFELGGHSLLVVRLISLIRKRLEVEIAVKVLFTYSTVAQLAVYTHDADRNTLPPVVAVMPRPQHIPLSYSQERLWFIDQLEGSLPYHIPSALRLHGRLDVAALSSALRTIVNRHEVLRTVMVPYEGVPYQQVLAADSWELTHAEDTICTADEITLSAYLAVKSREAFDLKQDHMLRAHLVTRGSEDHLLLVTMHHIASDGWSTGIIVRELAALYNAYAVGHSITLPPLPVQYADYSIWQRSYVSGAILDKKLDYWKLQLQGFTTLQLPGDYVRPSVQSSRGDVHWFHLDERLLSPLKQLSRQHGTTLFMTLLAAFKVLLHRYSGQEDICVGTSVAGRTSEDVEGLIGFFVNTLVLRSHVSSEQSFASLLEQVKHTTLSAYDHQEVPFEKVVEAVVRERDVSRHPLFQVMFALQNTPEVPDLELNGLRLSQESVSHSTTQFDLTLSLEESATGLSGYIEYCADLFTGATIAGLQRHYEQLLWSVVNNPAEETGLLEMMGGEEKTLLVETFNDTTVAYPADKTLVGLFREQAARTPDNTALLYEGVALSYRELEIRTDRVAAYLQSKGVASETLVPVCLERSADMVIGILGILKAGGAYVPVDPSYPAERILYMLSDTGASVILSSAGLSAQLPATDATIVLLEDIFVNTTDIPVSGLPEPRPHHLAYVIYTSGSTGVPKGVMIEHQGLLNHLYAKINALEINGQSVIAQTASYSFDISVWQMFAALVCGGTTVIYHSSVIYDPSSLLALTHRSGVTILELVPSYLSSLLQSGISTPLKGLRYLLVTGEEVSATLLEQWFGHAAYGGIPVVNAYGPTEASDNITHHIMSSAPSGSTVPLGRPVQNLRIYVLDKRGCICPVGVWGEICVSGIGVGRGYLNRASLTEEKFVADPFVKGARMYRTGDLGRWLADGTIAYGGRLDRQVKIHGYRIELGEVESVLSGNEQVHQAVVVAQEAESGHRRLVGYVVPRADYDKETVQSWLKARLPAYMVPAVLVTLEALPLTPNGKVDRKSLPQPDEALLQPENYAAPETATEQLLAGIWQALLGKERIGIHDNFFELGGHSLLVMRLNAAIHKELGIEIPASIFFQLPTIDALAKHIKINQQHAAPDDEDLETLRF